MLAGVSVIKNKGFVLPRPTVEKLFKESTFLGGANPMKGDPGFDIGYVDTLPNIDTFLEGLEAAKDQTLAFYFAKSDQKITEESSQPFRILNDAEGECILLAMLTGSFPGYVVENSPHSTEYHLVNELLIPKIKKMWKVHNGDLKSLTTEISTDTVFEKEMHNLSINDGKIIFWSATGEIKKFEHPKAPASFSADWGYLSNANFLGEGGSPAEAEKSEKKSGMMSFLGGGKKKEIADTTSLTDKNSIAKENKADTGVDKTQRPMITPPTEIRKGGVKKMKEWYNNNCMITPPDGSIREGVSAPANDAWIARNPEWSNNPKYKPFGAALEEMKQKVTESKSHPLIMSAKSKGILTELIDSEKVQAIVGSGKLLDPDSLKKRTEEVGDFFEQSGYSIEDTFRWDHEVLVLIGRKVGIEELAQLCVAYQTLVMDAYKEEAINGTPPKDAPATQPKDEPATKEKTEPAPADSGKKTGGMMAFLKKSA